jgi:vacuolar-type H+-ATPase subunit F/Vma7
MSQIIAEAVKKYMEAVELRLTAFRDEQRATLEENRTLREELRSLQSEIVQTRSVQPDFSEAINRAVTEQVRSAVAEIPSPKDGKDAELPDIGAMVERAVAALPKPKDGENGQGVDPAEVQRMVAETVERAVAAIPSPKDGKDADMDALSALVTAEVARAAAPLPSMVDEALTRAVAALPGPKDGENGKDGIATREELDEIIEARFAEIAMRNLADLHRGVWKAGESYKRGELAVLDGSTWLAKKDNPAAPGSGPDWTLFAKQGRPGRDKT